MLIPCLGISYSLKFSFPVQPRVHHGLRLGSGGYFAQSALGDPGLPGVLPRSGSDRLQFERESAGLPGGAPAQRGQLPEDPARRSGRGLPRRPGPDERAAVHPGGRTDPRAETRLSGTLDLPIKYPRKFGTPNTQTITNNKKLLRAAKLELLVAEGFNQHRADHRQVDRLREGH